MKQTILSVMMTISLLMSFGNAAAEDAPPLVQLPVPTKTGGMPLADALAARRSTRSFADVELSPQQLSNLLWATAGINRDDGHTTYPVGRGRKDMTLFAVTKSDVFCP